MDLKGTIAVVTGSSSGIGLSITRALLGRGSEVYGLSRSETTIDNHAFHWLRSDVTSEEELDRAFDAVLRRHGRIDLLVNNAGFGLFGNVEEIDPETWRKLIDVNLTGVFLCTRKVVPGMKERKSGTIVNIGSIAGTHGVKGAAAYCATKFAVNGFSESLMDELREYGIRVACINPGSVETPFFDQVSYQPKRFMKPDDIAKLVLSVIELPDNMLVDQLTVRPL